GLFIGVFVPLAAAAVAAVTFAPARRFALAAGFAALVVCVVCLGMIFHLEPAQPGMRALFGKTLATTREYLPWIGGTWRTGTIPIGGIIGWPAFDTVVNQVAFGIFPWAALAPVATLRLVLVRERDRVALGGLLALGFALATYVATSLWTREIGDVRYP